MLRAIDRLVIVVPELDDAIASYRGLGFTVTPGGRHPIGTHNALIGLADGSYLELIAFFEPNAQHRWYRRLQQGGGLVDFCMQTDDLAGDVAPFRDAGVKIAEPRPLSRVRPDGYTVRWTLSIPEEHPGVAPFLIAHETPREERVPRATMHANDATGFGVVTVAVEDVASVRRWYGRVPGTAVAPMVESWTVAGDPARCVDDLRRIIDQGVRGITLRITGWQQAEQYKRLVGDVLSKL